MNVKRAGMCRRDITLVSLTGEIELMVENISRTFFMENREEEELKVREDRRKPRYRRSTRCTAAADAIRLLYFTLF